LDPAFDLSIILNSAGRATIAGAGLGLNRCGNEKAQ
jgi:hypothetical protein